MIDDQGNEVYGCIYKLTCLMNNKCYIGETTNFEIRRKRHISLLKNNKHGNIHLQRAWNKYREHNFKFQILGFCSSREEIIEQEYECKIFFNVWDRRYGYNIATYDDSPVKGRGHTDETRKKMSKTKKELFSSGELIQWNKGKKLTAEQNKNRDHHGEKNPMFNKKHKESSKIIIGEKSKRKIYTKEYREKIGNAHRGSKRSEETKKKMSDSAYCSDFDNIIIENLQLILNLKKEKKSNKEIAKLFGCSSYILKTRVEKFIKNEK